MKNAVKEYGYFGENPGCYTIVELPKIGSFEYIYKNEAQLIKADQFGIITCQIDAPAGIALVRRENRETSSPIKVYFSFDGEVYNNFDVFRAKNIKIDFTPEKAVYALDFGKISVKTQLFVMAHDRRFAMRVEFINNTEKDAAIKIMPTVFTYVNDLLLAPWDKPEWYTRSSCTDDGAFVATKYSIAGKKEERRYFTCVSDLSYDSIELSYDRLVADTNLFNSIPDSFSDKTGKDVYAFSQCFAGIKSCTLKSGESFSFINVFATTLSEKDVKSCVSTSREYFSEVKLAEEEKTLKEKFAKLFSVRTVNTNDPTFNKFVNGFLPLELDWVSSLDRGWPTGMRGVRDAANDFNGFLAYDIALCRNIIENIFSKQKSDGWYPRQVPFGQSDKFDLRRFVDSACFFTEYVYNYLAYSDDYGILSKTYPYYDSEASERGVTHLIKGMEYLMKEENLGEHGLVKMQGGDWLDCLSGAGIKGRGESVMVSCQLVACLRELVRILNKIGYGNTEKYTKFAENLTEKINACAFNASGFYNGVYTDGGEWIFSEKDPDGESRIYVPTNSYAIISGVAHGKERKIIENIEELKTEDGYKLFSKPFGERTIEGIGKMGTGDFQPYFAENASVYNHGSQLFYIRALAACGEYEKLYNVLNYAMPFNKKAHASDRVCSAPYAITNCYHLIPSFCGRSGFSFLTGSVAMIERAVYNWMFGVSFTLDDIVFQPCLPEEYGNSKISMRYGDKKLHIEYIGFGNYIEKAIVNAEQLAVKDGKLKISKKELTEKKEIEFVLFLTQAKNS